MIKSRRNCGCNSKDPVVVVPVDIPRCRSLFPTDIKSLLILIAEDDDPDNRVDIVLDACEHHCFLEDVRPIAVMDNTVVVKDGDGCESKFRYICISCICEVIVDCDTILDELLEEHSINGE
jgi:hypothetical protein